MTDPTEGKHMVDPVVGALYKWHEHTVKIVRKSKFTDNMFVEDVTSGDQWWVAKGSLRPVALDQD